LIYYFAVECSLGWTLYQQKCLHFFNQPVTYTEAEKVCQSKDAKLVTIISEEENKFVLNFAKKKSKQYRLWIGAKRQGPNDKDFEWSNENEMIYSNWHTGEPNDVGNNEFYVEMHLNDKGEWNDAPNTNNNVFICEKNLVNQ